MTPGYEVVTLGALERARPACCAACAETMGIDLLDNPLANFGRELRRRAEVALAEARRAEAELERQAVEYAKRAAEKARARARELAKKLPSLPDPIPAADALVGPSGWGEYVPHAVALAVVGVTGVYLLHRSRPHAPKPVRRARR